MLNILFYTLYNINLYNNNIIIYYKMIVRARVYMYDRERERESFIY